MKNRNLFFPFLSSINLGIYLLTLAFFGYDWTPAPGGPCINDILLLVLYLFLIIING